MFSAKARCCDHMLYDGACECIERPNEYDGDTFLLELAAALAEEPILLEAHTQAEQYLAEECAEDDADRARLEEYLAELEREDLEEYLAELEREDLEVVVDKSNSYYTKH